MNGFRSMGCEVVVPYGVPLDGVRSLFETRDARFSRFLPSSELASVNASPLGLTLVSEEFASMLSLSLDAARATDGLVTPCVVGAVEPAAVPSFASVSLLGRGLLRAEPVQLDLNAVVKSRTVDDALALIGRRWVSAGGDVAAAEPVVVGLPGGGSVALHGGGLATSSVGKRRWPAAGRPQNHLIDPRTGRRTDSPWRDVTVAAQSCLVADVAAKAALLLGLDGPAWLDGRDLAGRFVDHEGSVRLNEAWAARAPAAAAA